MSTSTVLYVNRDKTTDGQFGCGSQCCIDLTQKLAPDAVTIQDVSVLQQNKINLPTWLNGTPILYESRTGAISRGTDAIKRLQSIVRAAPPMAPRTPSVTRGGMEPPQDDRPPSDDRKVTENDLQEYINKRRAADNARTDASTGGMHPQM